MNGGREGAKGPGKGTECPCDAMVFRADDEQEGDEEGWGWGDVARCEGVSDGFS